MTINELYKQNGNSLFVVLTLRRLEVAFRGRVSAESCRYERRDVAARECVGIHCPPSNADVALFSCCLWMSGNQIFGASVPFSPRNSLVRAVRVVRFQLKPHRAFSAQQPFFRLVNLHAENSMEDTSTTATEPVVGVVEYTLKNKLNAKTKERGLIPTPLL